MNRASTYSQGPEGSGFDDPWQNDPGKQSTQEVKLNAPVLGLYVPCGHVDGFDDPAGQ